MPIPPTGEGEEPPGLPQFPPLSVLCPPWRCCGLAPSLAAPHSCKALQVDPGPYAAISSAHLAPWYIGAWHRKGRVLLQAKADATDRSAAPRQSPARPAAGLCQAWGCISSLQEQLSNSTVVGAAGLRGH